jgi:RecB family exonuclease
MRGYDELLRAGHWLAPGELPGYLLTALEAGRLRLPGAVCLAGLAAMAPAEEAWFAAAALKVPVRQVRLQGHPENVRAAVALPDPRQEVEWVAAQAVEAASREGLPLHRLAITSPTLDQEYAPALCRVLAELLGPPEQDGAVAYNFSRGPALAETPLFLASLLPLQFAVQGQRRLDLVSLLLSPFFGACENLPPALAQADRAWREGRRDVGWQALRAILKTALAPEPGGPALLAKLDEVLASFSPATAPAYRWLEKLEQAWRLLGFPAGLNAREERQFARIKSLMEDVGTALGDRFLSGSDLLAWLKLGARRALLPGPGAEEAGIQVLGLLEMRGLDFDRIFCLGLNAGAFPAPARGHPLLTSQENARVQGGSRESQHHFARELLENLLAAAPYLVFTRPQVSEEEKQVATPLWLGTWQEASCTPLSRPSPAWLLAAPVQAALVAPAAPSAAPAEPPVSCALPDALRITQVQTALSCPCRFLLEVLLGVRELPEIEAGLSPLERGDRLHRLLARFVEEFREILHQKGDWDPGLAREMLENAGRRLLGDLLHDPHWQAEWQRWFGDAADQPGLLLAWLAHEGERFAQGWRWDRVEAPFAGLEITDCPFTLKGRIDRIDRRPDGGLMIWDYKTGEVPKPGAIFDEERDCQLAGYLLALKQGCLDLDEPGEEAAAGYIGLKSPRDAHLKYEDFPKYAHRWEDLLASLTSRLADLGARLGQGDFRPAPSLDDPRKGPCLHCPYPLVCGRQSEEAGEGVNGETEA